MKVKACAKGLLTLVLTLYPFCIYYGLTYVNLTLNHMLIGLFILGSLQWCLTKADKKLFSGAFIVCIAITLMFMGFVIDNENIGLFYPVAMNLLFMLVFLRSLYIGKPIIQQIAERFEKKALDEKGVSYTRNVTKIWVMFFALNMSVSLGITIFFDLDIWLLYNGLLSYIAIAGLLLIEYLYRKWILKIE